MHWQSGILWQQCVPLVNLQKKLQDLKWTESFPVLTTKTALCSQIQQQRSCQSFCWHSLQTFMWVMAQYKNKNISVFCVYQMMLTIHWFWIETTPWSHGRYLFWTHSFTGKIIYAKMYCVKMVSFLARRLPVCFFISVIFKGSNFINLQNIEQFTETPLAIHLGILYLVGIFMTTMCRKSDSAREVRRFETNSILHGWRNMLVGHHAFIM